MAVMVVVAYPFDVKRHDGDEHNTLHDSGLGYANEWQHAAKHSERFRVAATCVYTGVSSLSLSLFACIAGWQVWNSSHL